MASTEMTQTPLDRPSAHSKGLLRRILGTQEFILALAIILLLVIVGSQNPRYVATNNLITILQGNAYIAVAALGMTMVIISGNIDISVGSLIGVLAVISGSIANSTENILLAWIAPLFFGALVGGVIGFFVAYLKIPSIVVTLGMMSILKGGLISVTRGAWIDRLPAGYALSQQRILDIPMPIWFMIVLTIIVALWMRYSQFGRSIYAVGGNKEAARLSGFNDRRITFWVFVLNGFFVGIASVLYATQLSTIQSTVPAGVELLIITSSVVGGVSILGGVGTVIGSTLAAVLLNAINSSLIFINISPFWMRAFQGLLILATVLADLVRRKGSLIKFLKGQ